MLTKGLHGKDYSTSDLDIPFLLQDLHSDQDKVTLKYSLV